jgi:hypothetical protein
MRDGAPGFGSGFVWIDGLKKYAGSAKVAELAILTPDFCLLTSFLELL